MHAVVMPGCYQIPGCNTIPQHQKMVLSAADAQCLDHNRHDVYTPHAPRDSFDSASCCEYEDEICKMTMGVLLMLTFAPCSNNM